MLWCHLSFIDQQIFQKVFFNTKEKYKQLLFIFKNRHCIIYRVVLPLDKSNQQVFAISVDSKINIFLEFDIVKNLGSRYGDEQHQMFV